MVTVAVARPAPASACAPIDGGEGAAPGDLGARACAHVDQLDGRVKDAAMQRGGTTLLMTHPGVGPVTALATDVFLGDPSRFPDAKALANYVGLIPSEYSAGPAARKLGIRLWIMLRDQIAHDEFCRRSPRRPADGLPGRGGL